MYAVAWIAVILIALAFIGIGLWYVFGYRRFDVPIDDISHGWWISLGSGVSCLIAFFAIIAGSMIFQIH